MLNSGNLRRCQEKESGVVRKKVGKGDGEAHCEKNKTAVR